MSIFQKAGKGVLIAARAAEKLDEGFDKVFGENRTRPGDGFSMDSARQSSQEVTQEMRRTDKASFNDFDNFDDEGGDDWI